MSDVLNLKINERSNVERLNLRVIKIRNKNSEIKASKLIYIKELEKFRIVRNITTLFFQIGKNSINLLICQFEKFQKLPKFYNFENH